MDNKNSKNNAAPLMRGLDEKPPIAFKPQLLGIVIGAVILGIFTGYILAPKGNSNGNSLLGPGGTVGNISAGKTFGNGDPAVYKDSAEGTLKEGGIEGEGQFHLVRPGGDSQNVYMTSSTIDLSQFVGRKIKVWGQTQKAQHAGWLMDVGKVEVL